MSRITPAALAATLLLSLASIAAGAQTLDSGTGEQASQSLDRPTRAHPPKPAQPAPARVRKLPPCPAHAQPAGSASQGACRRRGG